jgi:uncharacterized protein YjbJ (UPF0337 family)
MNADQFKGQWHQIKGEIKNQWGKLTDDDVSRIEGNIEKLAGTLQERYGYAREQAQDEIDRWEARRYDTTVNR